MKTCIDLFSHYNGDGVRAKMEIQCIPHGVRRVFLLEINMGDLAQRMNTGIGTTCNMRPYGLAAKSQDCLFKAFLDRSSIGLVLPTMKRCTVIFDDEFVTGHSRLRPEDRRAGFRAASPDLAGMHRHP